MQIPNPSEGTDLVTWSQQVIYCVEQYSNIAPLENAKEWQVWGMLFVNDPTIGQLGPPNPYWYSDWIIWGQQLSTALDNASGALQSLDSGYISTGGGSPVMAQGGDWIQTQGGAPILVQDGNNMGNNQGGGGGTSPFQLTDDTGLINLTSDSGTLLTSQ
jgi:hypothetical protein